MNILNSPTTISQSNIFPKYLDNFGMVAIEAAAHGTPLLPLRRMELWMLYNMVKLGF